MYYLDYKIRKDVVIVSRKYEDKYIKYLSSFSDINMTNNRVDLIRKAVKCFFYNLTFSVAMQSKEVIVVLDNSYYSRPLIYNGKKVNRRVSYQYTKAFFSWLHTEGLAYFDIGFVGDWIRVDNESLPLSMGRRGRGGRADPPAPPGPPTPN